MSHIKSFASTLLSFSLMGCMDPSIPDPVGFTGNLKAQLTGIVAEEKGATGHYALVEAERTALNGTTIELNLPEGHLLTSDQYPKVEISRTVAGKSYHYEVVFGPEFGTTTSADGQVLLDTDGAPCVLVDNGWALFWGRYPMPYTTLVDAAGDGTTILVQEVGPLLHRVFFLDGTKVDVACRSGGTPQTINSTGNESKGMYLDVVSGTAGCSVVLPAKDVKGSGPDIEGFVQRAVIVAKAAKWPGTPVGYP